MRASSACVLNLCMMQTPRVKTLWRVTLTTRQSSLSSCIAALLALVSVWFAGVRLVRG
jgi:hypothetical protein